MDREQIIGVLRRNEPELRRRGISHAALFGSIARGDADDKSDIDIAIRLDPVLTAHMGMYDYVGLQQFIASLFTGKVDIIDRDWLKPHIREFVEADILDAF